MNKITSAGTVGYHSQINSKYCDKLKSVEFVIKEAFQKICRTTKHAYGPTHSDNE